MLAAFFVIGPPLQAAPGQPDTAQVLALDPQPLIIETKSGPRAYAVEIADDASERGIGMMFRKSAPAGRGMLFDFGQSRMVTMWMRDTFVSLDIVFIDDEMRVAKISANAEPLSLAIIGSGGPVRFALELAAGAAVRDGLKVGDRVQHPAMARAAEKEQPK